MILQQVVMLPSWGDEAAQIFQTLGAALPRIFNREGVKRQELISQIRANPALGQQLASQVRATTSAGAADANMPGLSNLAQTLGLKYDDPNNQQFLASLAASFPATMEEQLSSLLAGRPTGTESPIAQATANLVGVTTKEATEKARTGILQSLSAQQLESLRLATNFPSLLHRYERLTTEAGIEEQEQAIAAWGVMDQWLKANPEYAWAFASGEINTPFLEYMGLLQRLSLEEKLAMLKSRQPDDPVAAMSSLIALITDRNKLFNSITEAKQTADPETVAALNTQWEDLNAMIELIAARIPGFELSTIAMPGQEKAPVTYRTPREWTEYTSTFSDAALQGQLTRAWEGAIPLIGMQLAAYERGSPEWAKARADAINELKTDAEIFYKHLVDSGQLGLFFAEIDRWVREQKGEAKKEEKTSAGRQSAIADIERRIPTRP